MTLAQYLIALAAVTTRAVAQSSVGFGFGMIAALVYQREQTMALIVGPLT